MEALKGKIFTSVRQGSDSIILENETEKFVLVHRQDCCEYVTIDDINGELVDLENSPILSAVESTNRDIPARAGEYRHYSDGYESTPDSYTWTFYRIGTIKGTVIIRFYGSSNGYYSESVDLVRYVKEDNDWIEKW